MAARKHNKMWGLNLVLVFTFAIVQLSEGNYLSTPVMIWRNSRRFGADNVLAGHSFKASDVFEKYVQPELKELNIVLVFVQDELSMDDFTKYPESFNYLKYAIEHFSPLLLPSVSQDKQGVDKLIQNYAGQNLEEVFSSDLSDWKFDLQSKTLVYIFHLEPVNGAESKKEVFSQNNNHIKKIISAVEEAKKHYTVVFTSQHPSQFISNVLNMEQTSGSSISSRHLLGLDSANGSVQTITNGTLFNNTCVYLYASSIKFGPPTNLTEFITSNWSVSGLCFNGTNNSIILETKKNGDSFKMEIQFGFEDQSLYWTCLNITVDATINGTSNTTIFPCAYSYFANDSYYPVRAPIQFSYTCTDIKFISPDFILAIADLQLEPGMSSIHFFSTDYSCTGFFTLEILTGLMTIFVMILGLIVGIGMISAIQTQDRFDDPKGKTISVPLTE